jgi:hypothetical protein
MKPGAVAHCTVILAVRANIRTSVLGPLAGSLLETPHHLLEKSDLAPKNGKNPPYTIVTGGQD